MKKLDELVLQLQGKVEQLSATVDAQRKQIEELKDTLALTIELANITVDRINALSAIVARIDYQEYNPSGVVVGDQ